MAVDGAIKASSQPAFSERSTSRSTESPGWRWSVSTSTPEPSTSRAWTVPPSVDNQSVRPPGRGSASRAGSAKSLTRMLPTTTPPARRGRGLVRSRLLAAPHAGRRAAASAARRRRASGVHTRCAPFGRFGEPERGAAATPSPRSDRRLAEKSAPRAPRRGRERRLRARRVRRGRRHLSRQPHHDRGRDDTRTTGHGRTSTTSPSSLRVTLDTLLRERALLRDRRRARRAWTATRTSTPPPARSRPTASSLSEAIGSNCGDEAEEQRLDSPACERPITSDASSTTPSAWPPRTRPRSRRRSRPSRATPAPSPASLPRRRRAAGRAPGEV